MTEEEIPAPRHFRVETVGGMRKISWRPHDCRLSIIMGLLGLVFSAGSFAMAVKAHWVFMAFGVPLAVISLYGLLVGLLNRTVVKVSLSRLETARGPLPFPSKKRLDLADIGQLYLKRKIGDVEKISYEVYAVTSSGRHKKLLAGLRDGEAPYLEGEIERVLGREFGSPIEESAPPGCWNVALLLGMLALGFGTFFLVASARQTLDARRVKSSSVREVAGFQDAEPGEDVIFVGVLGGAPVTRSEAQVYECYEGFGKVRVGGIAGASSEDLVWLYAHRHALVVYGHQRWHVSKDDQGHWHGSWATEKCVAPEIVTIDGQSVQIGFAELVDFSSQCHYSDIVVKGDGGEYQDIRDGSIRAVGYKDGDLIAVFGRKGSDERLLIEHLYGGSYEQFLRYLVEEGRGLLAAGRGAMLVGLLCGLLWLAPRFVRRLRG